jgi:predicted dehydrogenase
MLANDDGIIKRPLKLAFLGGGQNSAVGYTHFCAARMDGLFELVSGCFSRDSAVNEETGRAFGVVESRIHSSIDVLLQEELGLVDAVCVLTPTPDHAETVVKCLSLGFNVICEKAIATSVAQCQEIQAALATSNGFLGLTFNYAGYPMVREAREIIRSGGIGRVQQVYCEMPTEHFSREGANPQAWRKKDYTIPCVSLDLGVHVHHLVHYLLGGKRPLSVQSKQASFGKVHDVVDTVALLADYEDGIMASFMWGKAALGYRNGLHVRVFGEEGALEWCQTDPETLHLATADGLRQTVDRGQAGLLEASKGRYNRFKAGHPAGYIEAFANVYADFAERIVHGSSSVIADSFSAEVAAQGISLMEEIARPQ